jgi:drug/metabolite transporter (DMT)-like permease
MNTRAAPPLWIAHAKLVIVSLCWGSTFIAGRVLAQGMPNLTAASSRFILASSIFLLLLLYQGPLPRLNRKQMMVTATMGFFGVFIANMFFFAALEKVPAGKTALIVSLSPILITLVVAFLLKDRIGMQRWTGIVLALLGVSLVITEGRLNELGYYVRNLFNTGEGFMLLSVCGWVVYTVLSRFALKGLTPLAATTYAALFGTLFLLVAALTEIPQWNAEMMNASTVGALVYLAAIGTAIPFLWYIEGIRAIGTTGTVIYSNLVPVFGVILSFLILSEPISLPMILGGLVVIAGVTLTNRSRS